MMYCSICGDEIVKGGRYYIEDGKVVCAECYNEEHPDDHDTVDSKLFKG
ncbi:MAG: LIM domain-containing protein [Candidatus Hermodarchaeota archaeon]